MTEKELSSQVEKYFKSLKFCIAIKKDQGPYSQKRGISDWIVGYKGYALFVELKVGKNKPTPLQENFINEARAAKCIGAVCYSLDEVEKIIKMVNNDL